jgi:UPF0755 protein
MTVTETPEVNTPSPEPPARKKGAFRHVLATLSALFTAAVLAPVLLVGALFAPGPLTEQATIVVPHGLHTAEIGDLLAKQDAVYASPVFRLAAKLVAGGSLKAGEYVLPPRASAASIATMMQEGRSVLRLFTVAEGLTSSEVVQMLSDDPVLTGVVEHTPKEGSLLPETYRYSYGDTRASLIARMQKGMQERLNEIWAARDQDLPLKSPAEAVILASIVEKETGRPEERPRIAGVFYNRLRDHMRLQSDPTVIYALTKGKEPLDRALTHNDLAYPSPINTYASDGLPPQPICNPGRAALEAVTHPEQHKFLYFVANGSGGHAFASDLATQDQNINRWHRLIENAAHQ